MQNVPILKVKTGFQFAKSHENYFIQRLIVNSGDLMSYGAENYRLGRVLEESDPEAAIEQYKECFTLDLAGRRNLLNKVMKYSVILSIFSAFIISYFAQDSLSDNPILNYLNKVLIYTIIISGCCTLPFIILMASMIYKTKMLKTRPEEYFYNALAGIGIIRCCRILKNRNITIVDHATLLIKSPIPGFPDVGHAALHMIRDDPQKFKESLEEAQKNILISKREEMEFMAALSMLELVAFPDSDSNYINEEKESEDTENAKESEVVEINNVDLACNLSINNGTLIAELIFTNNDLIEFSDIGIEILYPHGSFEVAKKVPDNYDEMNEGIIESLEPGQYDSITFYLMPLECRNTNIDAIAHYRDPSGTVFTTGMETLIVNIHANELEFAGQVTASTLKQLVQEELNFLDNRIFTMPAGMDPSNALDLARVILLGTDLSYIGNYLTDDPFHQEKWFYGFTKDEDQLAVRISVDKEFNTLEIFLAISSPEPLIGLLTMFDQLICEKLEDTGYLPNHLHDEQIKEAIMMKSLIFEQVD